MSQAICFDKNNNLLKFFYQWDINQIIKISGIENINNRVINIHFSNKNMDNALVVKPTILENSIIVSVPNIILTDRENLQIYIYEEIDNDNDGTNECGRTISTIHIPIKARQKPDDYFYDNNVEFITVKKYIDEAIEATNNINDLIESVKESAENGEFNGSTPEIGKNGNWYINGKDTGKPSVATSTVTAKSADKLTTSRALKVNLASTNTTYFNGSANATNIGVSGILQKTNGGTGNNIGYIQTGKLASSVAGEKATIEGIDNSGSGNYSHAEGRKTTAKGNYSHAEGSNMNYDETELKNKTITSSEIPGLSENITVVGSTAYGMSSHAEGSQTLAYGDCSHSEGTLSIAGDKNSHAEGYNSKATGDCSHSEGADTKALGAKTHAEGEFTQAQGAQSHAEGYNSKAIGDCSHAEGAYTNANGNFSHSEGRNAESSGNYSHAEGNQTVASGEVSHAEGNDTTASGDNSHAEGASTTASGMCSHAEGAAVTANGSCSHAEGYGSESIGEYSHAEGYYCKANDYSHVQGKYNIIDEDKKYAHIIGNGTQEDARSNAHTVDWNGNAWYKGNLYLGGTSQDDAEAYIANVPKYTQTDNDLVLVIQNGKSIWIPYSKVAIYGMRNVTESFPIFGKIVPENGISYYIGEATTNLYVAKPIMWDGEPITANIAFKKGAAERITFDKTNMGESEGFHVKNTTFDLSEFEADDTVIINISNDTVTVSKGI